MKRFLPFIIPFVVVFSAGFVAWIFLGSGLLDVQPANAKIVQHEELDAALGTVEISGMAHYRGTIKQKVPATMFTEAATYYVFPLFPPYDTKGRAIPALVRTTRKPERLVDFELMTLVTKVARVTPNKIPWNTEQIISKNEDYYFADDIVLLEPWEIREFVNPQAPAE